jgi:hypothetical protein
MICFPYHKYTAKVWIHQMWGELIYRSSIFFDNHITPIPTIRISIRIGNMIFMSISIIMGWGFVK